MAYSAKQILTGLYNGTTSVAKGLYNGTTGAAAHAVRFARVGMAGAIAGPAVETIGSAVGKMGPAVETLVTPIAQCIMGPTLGSTAGTMASTAVTTMGTAVELFGKTALSATSAGNIVSAVKTNVQAGVVGGGLFGFFTGATQRQHTETNPVMRIAQDFAVYAAIGALASVAVQGTAAVSATSLLTIAAEFATGYAVTGLGHTLAPSWFQIK